MIEAQDILSIIQKNDIKVEIEKLDHSEPLRDQGLDSLDMTSILFEIEEKFKIQVSEEDINQNRLSSIDAIVTFINNAKS